MTDSSGFSRGARSFGKLWKLSRQEQPGQRFQRLHRAWRDTTATQPIWMRLIVLIAGLLLVALGIVFSFIPGPASVFLIPGAILLAAESGHMAKLVDVVDKAINPYVERFVAFWKRSNRATRLAVEAGCLVPGVLVYFVVFG